MWALAVAFATVALAIGCGEARDAGRGARPDGPVSLAEAGDRWVTLRDGRMRYREIGIGDPVILLHDLAEAAERWSGTADSLARTHRVIVPDLGRGARGGAAGPVARPAEAGPQEEAEEAARRRAADVVILMDSLHLPDAHLLGYAWGGLVAAEVALGHAARVRSVTFVAAPDIRDSARLARAVTPAVVVLAADDAGASRARHLARWWRAARLTEVAVNADGELAMARETLEAFRAVAGQGR